MSAPTQTPPIPALLPERDALLAAVRDADPDDDLPALVYADWQDEHGQPEHAELIRVMCELPKSRKRDEKSKARRKVLTAQMKELFATPALQTFRALADSYWKFNRGFLPDFAFQMEDRPGWPDLPFVTSAGLPALPSRVPFDKLAWLWVMLPETPTEKHSAAVAALSWLRRVDRLGLNYWFTTYVRRGALAPLIECKHLGGLRKFDLGLNVQFDKKGIIPVGDLVGTYLAKSATNLREFPLADVQRLVTPNSSRKRSVTAFRSAVEQIFSSPRAKQFTSFDATYHAEVDTALARILLGSPHLGEVRKFGYTFGRITAAARAAFTERFGKPAKAG
jgi:uncharacterized protein (TIGR02996 family)